MINLSKLRKLENDELIEIRFWINEELKKRRLAEAKPQTEYIFTKKPSRVGPQNKDKREYNWTKLRGRDKA